jgi:Protein of unknown function (DUF3631)
MSDGDDFAQLMGPVIRRIRGEPNATLSSDLELRYGTHGSLSIDLKKGTWFDHEANEGGGVLDFLRREKRLDKSGAVAWLRQEGLFNGAGTAMPKLRPRLTATYDYYDEQGQLLFQVCRYEPKSFRQRRPDGNGGWVNGRGCMDGVRRVLYRLPELLEAVACGYPVLVVEGEKDVENLTKLGIAATCNPGGADKWLPDYNEHLRGADVVLVPDNDDAGHKHVQEVGAALSGIAARLRVLMIPDLPAKADISYWLEHSGGTRERLDELIEEAPGWQPSTPKDEVSADAAQKKAEAEAREKQLINELAKLSSLNYEKRRKQGARELGIRSSALDDAVEARRQEHAAEAGPPPLFGHWEVMPWPEEVDTGALLLRLVRRLKRHVIFEIEQAIAVALWILFSWVHHTAAVHSPILMATSAEANSGKTTLLDLVGFLTPRALLCVEISEATLFRGIELWQPTIIVDEADTILVNNEPLRAVINSGWTRGSFVPRCIGDDKVPHAFPTFCPKSIGLKGRKLPDTTLSRCIVIELKRKDAHERAEHFRSIDDRELEELREQALRWSVDTGEALKNAEPEMPPGFDNRLGDNWRLLLAIADLAGGEWPEQARQAAQQLSNVVDGASIGEQLLADIKAAFDEKLDDAIPSAALVEKLTAKPDARWSEWKSGKPLTQNQLARLLKPYGIAPEQVRVTADHQTRGYRRGRFEDAWKRYL